MTDRSIRGPQPEEGVCIKCKIPYVLEDGHECLEELTLDELFDSCLGDVRSTMAELGTDLQVEAAK